MAEYENDLALAMAYLEKNDATVDQLNTLAARLQGHAFRLPLSEATTVNRLKLQAYQLNGLAKKMQSTLLDDAQRELRIRNDRSLAAALGAAPSTVSRLRSGNLSMGVTLIVSLHELTGWPIRQIKAQLNLPSLSSLVQR